MSTSSLQKTIALQKIGITGGTNGNVSCGQCNPDSVHKLGDCIEKEETHKALNPISGKIEDHFKLSFYCPKKSNILIAGAVVWNHEIPEGT